MNYNLDAGLVNRLNNRFSTSEGTLPFPAPVLFVVNGDSKSRNDPAPAMYYGGWATDKAAMDSLLVRENRVLPSQLLPTDLVNQKGEMVEIYAARSLMVAPVVKRSIWISPNGDRTNDFIKGSRQHVQVLCVLGCSLSEGTFSPWGPVILSAKGFQARNLLESFNAWQRHTAVIRSKEAPGIPAWLFWMAVGTFGKERTQQMVGATSKSPITPIGAYLPSDMTGETLGRLYGGESLAQMIVKLNEDASDWTKAWSGTVQEGPKAGHTSHPKEYGEESEVPF